MSAPIEGDQAPTVRRAVMLRRICGTCSASFQIAESQATNGRGVFCSRPCFLVKHSAPRKTSICSTCKTELPATPEHFELNKACVGGLSSRCKPCSNARARKWRKDNRLLLARRWTEKYARGHKAAASKLDRYYRENQPQRSRATAMRNSIRARCDARGIPFDRNWLTTRKIFELLLATERCPVCDSEFVYPSPYGALGPSDRSVSLDRIIPSAGYVEGNVAIICWRCNALKRDALLPELEAITAWLRKVTSK